MGGTTKVFGSKHASGDAYAQRIVAEAVRQARLNAQTDPTFVPPTNDSSTIIATMMFGRRGSGGGSGRTNKTLTFDTHLDAGDPSYDGSADATLTSDATDVNTHGTIVARGASGDIAVSSITCDNVTASGQVNATGNVSSGADINANAGTVHGNNVTASVNISAGGSITASSNVTVGGNVTATGGTGTFLHVNSGDLTVSGGGTIQTSGGTVSGLHLVGGDLRINIAPTAGLVAATHTIPINVNGTAGRLLIAIP